MKFLGEEVGIPEFRPPTAWLEHGPFATWIVRVLQPRRLVELGTHYGYSYFSFCQAVLDSDLKTECIAVDTWAGDEHSGFYDDSVFAKVAEQNRRYAQFSRLLRKTFDAALVDIEDGTVDLLHIDGRHFYEDVKRDFQTWLPKLSSAAVVVFHDTEVRDRGFGVHKFWNEVSAGKKAINFRHGYGLGILFWGDDIPDAVLHMFFSRDTGEPASSIEDYFFAMGKLMTRQSSVDNLTVEIQMAEERSRNLEGRLIAVHDTQISEMKSELLAKEEQLITAERLSRQQHELFAELQPIVSDVKSRLEHGELRARSVEQSLAAMRQSISSLHCALDLHDNLVSSIEVDFEHQNKLLLDIADVVSADRKRLETLENARRDIAKSIEYSFLASRNKRGPGVFSMLRWTSAYLSSSRAFQFSDFILLKRSVLFDEDYYRGTNPDVEQAGMDPVCHYLEFGASQGRNPGPLFCEVAYRNIHEDVRAAGMPGLVHFERFGRSEGKLAPSELEHLLGLSLTASPQHIAAQSETTSNTDDGKVANDVPYVPAIIDDSNWSVLKPLVKQYFDARWYKDTYPDLADLSDKEALKHFILFGSAELRKPNSKFDPSFYFENNPDTRGQNPLAHYLLFGRAEGRQPRIFSVDDLSDGTELLSSVGRDLRTTGAGSYPVNKPQKVCCLVHVYYPELIDELLDYVNNVTDEKDVFVNLVTTTWTIDAHARIIERFPNAMILISQDHGRDIGGFARLLSIVDIAKYDIFLFSHSKKSPHLPPERGERWRRELLEPIVGSPQTAALCLRQMRSNGRMGLIGSAKWRCKDILANSSKFGELLDVASIPHDKRHCDFVSGTMFFVVQPVVRRLNMVLRKIVFEDGHDTPLSFHIDGQYAHAVERLIGNLVLDEGMFTWYK